MLVLQIAYPLIGSMYALHSKDDDDENFWLMYWIIFAVLKIADKFAQTILINNLAWIFDPVLTKMGLTIQEF